MHANESSQQIPVGLLKWAGVGGGGGGTLDITQYPKLLGSPEMSGQVL